jgi:hypothetical protein
MVVLDSVYNFTPGLDLKERGVGQLFARLKAEVCDATGCTVVAVDHMPWATEQNRKRLRGYGDVFKGAAARAGIYIDAEGSKLHVEARVLEWLVQHPGSHPTSAVRKSVKGNDTRIDSALERLLTAAEVREHGRGGGPWSGRPGAGRYWIASAHAAQTSAPLFEPRSAEDAIGGSEEETSAAPAHTRRVAEVDRAEVITSPDQDEIERLAALAREGAP